MVTNQRGIITEVCSSSQFCGALQLIWLVFLFSHDAKSINDGFAEQTQEVFSCQRMKRLCLSVISYFLVFSLWHWKGCYCETSLEENQPGAAFFYASAASFSKITEKRVFKTLNSSRKTLIMLVRCPLKHNNSYIIEWESKQTNMFQAQLVLLPLLNIGFPVILWYLDDIQLYVSVETCDSAHKNRLFFQLNKYNTDTILLEENPRGETTSHLSEVTTEKCQKWVTWMCFLILIWILCVGPWVCTHVHVSIIWIKCVNIWNPLIKNCHLINNTYSNFWSACINFWPRVTTSD